MIRSVGIWTVSPYSQTLNMQKKICYLNTIFKHIYYK